MALNCSLEVCRRGRLPVQSVQAGGAGLGRSGLVSGGQDGQVMSGLVGQEKPRGAERQASVDV